MGQGPGKAQPGSLLGGSNTLRVSHNSAQQEKELPPSCCGWDQVPVLAAVQEGWGPSWALLRQGSHLSMPASTCLVAQVS